MKCAFVDYADFQALVHADVAILEDAAACFKTKADEIAVRLSRAGWVNSQQVFSAILQIAPSASTTITED